MRQLFIFFFLINTYLMGQNHPPLNEIPTAPEKATTGNIIARMLQGLGYRYYWATKDLRIEDLSYRPSKEGASTFETLAHIFHNFFLILLRI